MPTRTKPTIDVTARLTNHGLHFKVVTKVDDPRCGLAEITSEHFINAPRKKIIAALATVGFVPRR